MNGENLSDQAFWHKKLDPHQGAPKRSPDDTFLLPIDIEPRALFGEKRRFLAQISQASSTYCRYNNQSRQVEIWGSRTDVQNALAAWKTRIESIHRAQEQAPISRRSKGWARPEKPKSEKALQKEQKKLKRQQELRRYTGIPRRIQAHQAYFMLPESIDIEHSYGDSLPNVHGAVQRLKNHYVHLLQKGKDGVVINILDQPNQDTEIVMQEPDSKFQLPIGISKVRLLKPIGPHSTNNPTHRNSETEIDKIRQSNLDSLINTVRHGLLNSLIFHGLLRLRIRIGTICLTDFPRNPRWSLDQLRNDGFNNSRVQCAFARSLNITEPDFHRLLQAMNQHAMEFMDNPRKTYTLVCNTRQMEPRGKIHITLEFKPDGRLGLWHGYNKGTDISTVNWSTTDLPYDFQIGLDAYQPLDNEHPQLEQFVNHLRMGRDGKLGFVNTENMALIMLIEKTRWQFEYRKYTIELTKANIWFFDLPTATFNVRNMEHTVNRAPDRTSFTLSMHLDSWSNAFSENQGLPIGGCANWKPEDLITLDSADNIRTVARQLITLLDDCLNT